MVKTKLTLSIDKKIIKDAKIQALDKDVSISDIVEEFLKSVGYSWVEELMLKIGIKERYVSYEDVIRRRPRGSGNSSTDIIRRLRDERETHVHG
jgi:hypothetical protein